MHHVQLLAVVLVGLDAGVRRRAVAELSPEGVVVHRLDDAADTAAVGFRHLTDVAEVVTVVVAERELVLAGIIDVALRLAVAFLELVFVDASVPQREAAAEQVVRGVGVLYLIGCQLPRAADRDADVRHCRLVRDAQLLTRGAIDIPRHVAVGELDADRVVAQVIVYPCYPASCVAHEGARAVVGQRILLPGNPVEVRRAGIRGV